MTISKEHRIQWYAENARRRFNTTFLFDAAIAANFKVFILVPNYKVGILLTREFAQYYSKRYVRQRTSTFWKRFVLRIEAYVMGISYKEIVSRLAVEANNRTKETKFISIAERYDLNGLPPFPVVFDNSCFIL